jgi:drug/metabolite transporter (DMT)-like permease
LQPLAYGIVISSTATHAYWNFLLKRARGGTIFIGLSKVAEVVCFAPLFAWAGMRAMPIPSHAIGLAVVGAALVLLNYVALARAYASGDLSLVYPVSRAGILLFLPLLGFLVFGERLTVAGWAALFFIMMGIAALQLPRFSRDALGGLRPQLRSEAVAFALAAALFAAIYTVWDKRAVRQLQPFVYFYSYTAIVAASYALFLWRRYPREAVARVWQADWRSIMQVGVFNTVTYLLVLIALRDETSSYVVALRQLSIVWGILLGRFLLGETIGVPKRVGAALLVAGCGLVALTQ